MAHDLTSKFYSCLNLPVYQKLAELTRIIDQSSPNKELQALFPQLISHIFATSLTNGWGLRNSYESNKYDYEHLLQFLEPQGPMFRLCYKLLSDPQLKYEIPLNTLPLDLQMTLEMGRYSQFYADMLATDPQTMNVSALMLNPFDYYIFNFALHLINNNLNKTSWENKNSVYFTLACDYLLHFLPVDPNIPVLPIITNYTGKMNMAAPLQTANRPYSPSLLLMSDLSGAIVNNQHPQNQSRNEVWRSETVLQVFIDVWLSVDQFTGRSIDMFQRSLTAQNLSPERVRTVRVLVKHLHSFSAKHLSETATRSAALRKYARQLLSARGYHYVRHLVTVWPLDASFRLVLELWLSLIQPWRYVNNCISREILSDNNQEESPANVLDPSYVQFIAENFPSYTCVFQLVLPRFMRLDLASPKNAVMLFRLGKVFSQPHLVPILKNLEQAIMESGPGLQHSPDTSFNNSGYDQGYNNSFSNNGMSVHKWAGVAKQAISEFNLSASFEYEPVWCDAVQQLAADFVRKILHAKIVSENNIEDSIKTMKLRNKGIWAVITEWLMINGDEENSILEESKRVPTYLNSSVHFFCNIFMINNINAEEPVLEDNSLEGSSFGTSTDFATSITNRLRKKPTAISYMGDPDLMPITTYESTILVRMLYQIASKINELYEEQFVNFWNRNDFWGFVAKEILQKPCRIQSYVKDMANYQNVVSQELPARLSLRKLGSHAFVVWFTIGYLIFKMFSYSGFFYIFILVSVWMLYVLTKASLKLMKL